MKDNTSPQTHTGGPAARQSKDVATVKPKRPFGVSVVAFMNVLNGLLSALILYADRQDGGALTTQGEIDYFSASVGLIGLILAVGLWRLHRWAWVATMIFVGVSLLNLLRAYVDGHPDYPLMVINVVTVFYLNQRDVQRVFMAPKEERTG